MSWRNEPATEKQLAYIMQMQENAGMNGAIPLPRFMGKTKGEASDYIDANNVSNSNHLIMPDTAIIMVKGFRSKNDEPQ